MKRRRVRKYRSRGRNSLMKFIGFLGIIILAVLCGYLTAKYVLAPFMGYDTDALEPGFTAKLSEVFSKNRKPGPETGEKEEGEKGYALQFGAFSTKDRAEKLASELEDDIGEIKVIEKDGRYKVIGEVDRSKGEASDALKDLVSDAVKDVFVTVIP